MKKGENLHEGVFGHMVTFKFSPMLTVTAAMINQHLYALS